MFRTEVHVQVHFFRAIFDSSFRFNIRSEFLGNETDFCKWQTLFLMEFTLLNYLNFDIARLNREPTGFPCKWWATKMCLRLNSIFNKTHPSRSYKQYSRVNRKKCKPHLRHSLLSYLYGAPNVFLLFRVVIFI